MPPQGGNLSDALVDLTGGVSAHLDLTLGGYTDDFEKRKQLFKMMRKEMDEHALMCCAISVRKHNTFDLHFVARVLSASHDILYRIMVLYLILFILQLNKSMCFVNKY